MTTFFEPIADGFRDGLRLSFDLVAAPLLALWGAFVGLVRAYVRDDDTRRVRVYRVVRRISRRAPKRNHAAENHSC